MDKYENLGVVGEGSYGIVMKCRHKDTRQIVAIKKFMETDDDELIRKIALREIRMLKKLRHENLVNLMEVFRRKRHLYLVFEYVSRTILNQLEQHPHGLDPEICRQYIWQVVRAVDFCHAHNIIHRDIKPENVLVSKLGVIKLCDFGFARVLSTPGVSCTDYVATRWYRAPELLVGDTKYGKEVDVWSIGCLFAEMLTGEPLFPGESDIDQLFNILRHIGGLAPKHKELMDRNPVFIGLKAQTEEVIALATMFPCWPGHTLGFLQDSLQLDPSNRPSATELLEHDYFTWDRFPEKFMPELRKRLQEEFTKSHQMTRQTQSHQNSPEIRLSGGHNKNLISKKGSDKGSKYQQERTPEKNVFPLTNGGDTNTASRTGSITNKLLNLPKPPSKIAPLTSPRPHFTIQENEVATTPEIRGPPLAIIPPICQTNVTSVDNMPQETNLILPPSIINCTNHSNDEEKIGTSGSISLWANDKLMQHSPRLPALLSDSVSSPSASPPVSLDTNIFVFDTLPSHHFGQDKAIKKRNKVSVDLPRVKVEEEGSGLMPNTLRHTLQAQSPHRGKGSHIQKIPYKVSTPKFLSLDPLTSVKMDTSPAHARRLREPPPSLPWW